MCAVPVFILEFAPPPLVRANLLPNWRKIGLHYLRGGRATHKQGQQGHAAYYTMKRAYMMKRREEREGGGGGHAPLDPEKYYREE